ncbi:unnamed protein product, partial [Prorocentrum cordatum]
GSSHFWPRAPALGSREGEASFPSTACDGMSGPSARPRLQAAPARGTAPGAGGARCCTPCPRCRGCPRWAPRRRTPRPASRRRPTTPARARPRTAAGRTGRRATAAAAGPTCPIKDSAVRYQALSMCSECSSRGISLSTPCALAKDACGRRTGRLASAAAAGRACPRTCGPSSELGRQTAGMQPGPPRALSARAGSCGDESPSFLERLSNTPGFIPSEVGSTCSAPTFCAHQQGPRWRLFPFSSCSPFFSSSPSLCLPSSSTLPLF